MPPHIMSGSPGGPARGRSARPAAPGAPRSRSWPAAPRAASPGQQPAPPGGAASETGGAGGPPPACGSDVSEATRSKRRGVQAPVSRTSLACSAAAASSSARVSLFPTAAALTARFSARAAASASRRAALAVAWAATLAACAACHSLRRALTSRSYASRASRATPQSGPGPRPAKAAADECTSRNPAAAALHAAGHTACPPRRSAHMVSAPCTTAGRTGRVW